ncbi:hypothetical protein UFOVP257_378 [uncultured Caudovirales phage]|uniref:Uncharacterized protein n=1 Tax=uncultured Caudovirales phage TaxID=2100421 RepID=A0A6J5LKL5_9CAUD|nr:hypothetical protein UFOVP257_378 [uncultured Caudovirales phage]
MKWLDRWLYRKVRDMWDHSYKYNDDSIHIISSNTKISRGTDSSETVNMDNSLRFNVLPALGGTVVEVRHPYEQKIDRSPISIHVIPDGEDISEHIGRIISLELLKKG